VCTWGAGLYAGLLAGFAELRTARVIRFALLCLVLACSSRRSAISTGSIDAAIAAPSIDAAACAAGYNMPNGACATDSDCVLTDLADACDACNVAMAYVTRKVTLDAHVARCAATPSCTSGCPPHDKHIPAFYRAECRSRRCIAWRFHGGG
jgi:hypothetical protein